MTQEQNQRHVMLSYEWKVQKLVLSIYEYLVSKEMAVWMDVKSGITTANLFEGIGEAIENSSCFVCFMTPEYQESDFCKQECLYAKQCKVPMIPIKLEENWDATSWLGLITAGLVWVPFDPTENLETTTTQLYRRICKTIGSQLPRLKSESRETEPITDSYSFPKHQTVSCSRQNKTVLEKCLDIERSNSLTTLPRRFPSHLLQKHRMTNNSVKKTLAIRDEVPYKYERLASTRLETSQLTCSRTLTPHESAFANLNTTHDSVREKSAKQSANDSYGNYTQQLLPNGKVSLSINCNRPSEEPSDNGDKAARNRAKFVD